MNEHKDVIDTFDMDQIVMARRLGQNIYKTTAREEGHSVMPDLCIQIYIFGCTLADSMTKTLSVWSCVYVFHVFLSVSVVHHPTNQAHCGPDHVFITFHSLYSSRINFTSRFYIATY